MFICLKKVVQVYRKLVEECAVAGLTYLKINPYNFKAGDNEGKWDAAAKLVT